MHGVNQFLWRFPGKPNINGPIAVSGPNMITEAALKIYQCFSSIC